MDYSKVKYVKPSCDGNYITKGKVYEFEFDCYRGGYCKDDDNQELYIYIPESTHINGKHWIPCDEQGNELGGN